MLSPIAVLLFLILSLIHVIASELSGPELVSLGSKMFLTFNKNTTHLAINVTNKDGGYISIGPGSLMVGSTVIIGTNYATSGMVSFGVYRIISKHAQPYVTLLSSSSDTLASIYGITRISFSIIAEVGSQVQFVLELAKQDASFNLCPTPSCTTNMIFASGSSSQLFDLHLTDGVVSINFMDSVVSTNVAALSSQLAVHILFMISSWCVLFPVAMAFPLFNNPKHGKTRTQSYRRLHMIVSVFALVINLVGVLLGITYVNSIASSHFSDAHNVLGLVVLIASFVQAFMGMYRLYRPRFYQYHNRFGYLVLVLSFAVCLLGVAKLQISMGGGDAFYSYYGVVGIVGFKGGMGVAIIILCSLSAIILSVGLIRSSRASMQVDAPAFKDKSDIFTLQEVNDREFLLCYQHLVLDVSNFIMQHPGGKVLLQSGKDITHAFDAQGHSANAKTTLNKLVIGTLAIDDENSMFCKHDIKKTNVFLKKNLQFVKLLEKTAISQNVFQLKFGTKPGISLGLPVGKHVLLTGVNPSYKKSVWNGTKNDEMRNRHISRKYTPVETDGGSFTVLTKVYRPTDKFEDGGRMSKVLDSLIVGDTLQISGPFGVYEYLQNGRFRIGNAVESFKELAFLVGGTGITPALQIIENILLNPQDSTLVSLVFCNSTPNEVFYKTRLDEFTNAFPNRIRVWFTVSSTDENWQYSVGRVSKRLLEDHFPAPTSDVLVITCGPKSFTEYCKRLLNEMEFSRVVEY